MGKHSAAVISIFAKDCFMTFPHPEYSLHIELDELSAEVSQLFCFLWCFGCFGCNGKQEDT